MVKHIQNKPYTYLIKFIPTGQIYYGVRWANKVTPEDDLWKKYFTSSKYIKELIDEYGSEWFEYEVRQVFESVDKARKWEERVLIKMNVVADDRWLNKTDNISIISLKGEHHPHYGKKFSDETRKKQSLALKGKIRTKEHCKNLSNAMTGKKHSDETKKKMSEERKNRPYIQRKRIECPHCHLIGGSNNMPRYHFDNCKSKPKGGEQWGQ